MAFVDANPRTILEGLDEQMNKSHYLIGTERQQWRTHVPNYARVMAKDLYPGIDLIYHGDQRQLEYDFIVAPNARPDLIRLAFDGIETLRIDSAGDLLLNTRLGELRQPKPVAYQHVKGERHRVIAHYVQLSGHEVGFRLEGYDQTEPLVIDPVVSYSSYLGGNDVDLGLGIAVDSAGNAYITGETWSRNFPTVNPLQGAQGGTCLGGCVDVFVAKVNPTGSALIYSTYLGGNGNDSGNGIAVDNSGNAYIAGVTTSTNFPTINAFQPTHGGSLYDGFIAKLDPTGSALVYSTYLGGSSFDQANAIAVDGAQNAYVTGVTVSANFPTKNPFQSILRNFDAFVTKVDSTGSLVYSSYLGGGATEQGSAIAVDDSGNAYVAGTTTSTDFPTVNPFQPTYGGPSICTADDFFSCGDVFVAKVNPTGSGLIYSTYLGGSGDDNGLGIAVDRSGNAYVTGSTTSLNFPTANALQPTYGGGESDAFVAKLNSTGSGLVYSTYLGGSNFDRAGGIVVDASGGAYVAGRTASTNFPVVNAFQSSFAGGNSTCYDAFCGDAFVVNINAAGFEFNYSTYLGGSGSDEATGIAVDSLENVYVTGFTGSFDFPTVNRFQVFFGGGINDAFVVKIAKAIDVNIDIKPNDFPNSIKLTSEGKIAVAILSTANFNAPERVDQASLTFGRSGDERSLAFCDAKSKDQNKDKVPDLVCYFTTGLTGFRIGDTVGLVKGRDVSGTPIRGMDSVRILP